MARLITPEELDERIVELKTARQLMTPDHVICEKCLLVYPRTNQHRGCYCDYESDRSFE
jgi:hypothetical protein